VLRKAEPEEWGGLRFLYIFFSGTLLNVYAN
jgi:hypothetical protein